MHKYTYILEEVPGSIFSVLYSSFSESVRSIRNNKWAIIGYVANGQNVYRKYQYSFSTISRLHLFYHK